MEKSSRFSAARCKSSSENCGATSGSSLGIFPCPRQAMQSNFRAMVRTMGPKVRGDLRIFPRDLPSHHQTTLGMMQPSTNGLPLNFLIVAPGRPWSPLVAHGRPWSPLVGNNRPLVGGCGRISYTNCSRLCLENLCLLLNVPRLLGTLYRQPKWPTD